MSAFEPRWAIPFPEVAERLFSFCDLKRWLMTLTIVSELDSVKMNHAARQTSESKEVMVM